MRDTARATTTSQPTNRAPNEPAMDKKSQCRAKLSRFWAIIGLTGSFGALLVGWLVVGCGAQAALTIEHQPLYNMSSVKIWHFLFLMYICANQLEQ